MTAYSISIDMNESYTDDYYPLTFIELIRQLNTRCDHDLPEPNESIMTEGSDVEPKEKGDFELTENKYSYLTEEPDFESEHANIDVGLDNIPRVTDESNIFIDFLCWNVKLSSQQRQVRKKAIYRRKIIREKVKVYGFPNGFQYVCRKIFANKRPRIRGRFTHS